MKIILFMFLIIEFIFCQILYIPQENQKGLTSEYVDGDLVVSSAKKNSSMTIFSVIRDGSFIYIDMAIESRMKDNFNFLPEKNIKTIAYKKSGGSKLLKTLSPKEYIKKLTKKQKRGQAWARFGESMNNFNSGKKTAHTKFNNGSVYGGGGTGLSATTTIDDPDARRRANRESEQRLANMASIRNSIIQNANQSLLKANTMSYGEMTGGRVVINSESPYGEKYNFRIAIGSDIHKIIFVKE